MPLLALPRAACLAAAITAVLAWTENDGTPELPDLIEQAFDTHVGVPQAGAVRPDTGAELSPSLSNLAGSRVSTADERQAAGCRCRCCCPLA